MLKNLEPPFIVEGKQLIRPNGSEGANIEAVFTTQELAEKVATLLNRESATRNLIAALKNLLHLSEYTLEWHSSKITDVMCIRANCDVARAVLTELEES